MQNGCSPWSYCFCRWPSLVRQRICWQWCTWACSVAWFRLHSRSLSTTCTSCTARHWTCVVSWWPRPSGPLNRTRSKSPKTPWMNTLALSSHWRSSSLLRSGRWATAIRHFVCLLYDNAANWLYRQHTWGQTKITNSHNSRKPFNVYRDLPRDFFSRLLHFYVEINKFLTYNLPL